MKVVSCSEHFMQKFSFPVPLREYAIVFGAIPDCVKPLVKPGPKGPLCSPIIFDNTCLFVNVNVLSAACQTRKFAQFLAEIRFLCLIV